VQVLIDQLGLRAAAHTIIGDEAHRCVSGGEHHRVSIGTSDSSSVLASKSPCLSTLFHFDLCFGVAVCMVS
jgi:hypothetical protein